MDSLPPIEVEEISRPRRRRLRLLPGVGLITSLFSLAARLVLIAILVGVFGTLVLFAYFLVGHTWGLPVILSTGSDRVIQVQRDWLERNLRIADLDDRIQVLRRQLVDVQNSVQMASLTAGAEAQAVHEDEKQNALEIEVVRAFLARETKARDEATALLARIGQLPDPEKGFDQGLVTVARLLTQVLGKADLSIKLTTLNSTITDAAAHLANLERKQASSHAAAAIIDRQSASGSHLGHDELQYVTTWEQAILGLRTGQEEVQRIRRSIDALERVHTNLLQSLHALAESPLLAAAKAPTAVIFVPYGNAANFRTGEPLFRCHLTLVACSQVGVIGPIVDGEVTEPHPFFGRVIRGSFYSINMPAGVREAEAPLLFSAPPLFFWSPFLNPRHGGLPSGNARGRGADQVSNRITVRPHAGFSSFPCNK